MSRLNYQKFVFFIVAVVGCLSTKDWFFSSRNLIIVVSATIHNDNNNEALDCTNNDNDGQCYFQNEEFNYDDDYDDYEDVDADDYDNDVDDDDVDEEAYAVWIDILKDSNDDLGPSDLKKLWDKRSLFWEAYFKCTDQEVEDFVYDFFECERYDEEDDEPLKTNSIPDSKVWMDLREAYDIAVGGYPRSTINTPPSEESGFLVPVEVKRISQAESSSRAVYATQPIKKGDLIWIPKQTGMLKGDEYRIFLAHIPTDLVCDAWGWLYPIRESEEMHEGNIMVIDMDECAILTSQEVFDDEEYNVGCLHDNDDVAAATAWIPGGCEVNVFAVRDIDAGEKIVGNFIQYSIWNNDEWHEQILQQYTQKHTPEEAFIQNLRQESKREPQQEDFTWEAFFQMKHPEIEDFYNCGDHYGTEQKIPDETVWQQLREAYNSAVGESNSKIAYPDSTNNGFFVDIEVKQSEGKGRGIFLSEPVKQGDLLWTARQVGKFQNGAQYRKFLTSIPSDLVCDVLQWSYVEIFDAKYPTPSKSFIVTDLDECCLINSEIDLKPNIGCIPDAEWIPGGCDTNEFATRDIEAGEELLCNYGDFAISYGWQWFAL